MRFIPDTHSLLWYLEKSPRLSDHSRSYFDSAEEIGQVIVPTIVLAELLYLSRKYPVPAPFEEILKFLEREERFEICTLDAAVIRQAINLTGFEIHDALIVATALHLRVPLMTRDERIRELGLVAVLKP